jgi:hypothetical protein
MVGLKSYFVEGKIEDRQGLVDALAIAIGKYLNLPQSLFIKNGHFRVPVFSEKEFEEFYVNNERKKLLAEEGDQIPQSRLDLHEKCDREFCKMDTSCYRKFDKAISIKENHLSDPITISEEISHAINHMVPNITNSVEKITGRTSVVTWYDEFYGALGREAFAKQARTEGIKLSKIEGTRGRYGYAGALINYIDGEYEELVLANTEKRFEKCNKERKAAQKEYDTFLQMPRVEIQHRLYELSEELDRLHGIHSHILNYFSEEDTVKATLKIKKKSKNLKFVSHFKSKPEQFNENLEKLVEFADKALAGEDIKSGINDLHYELGKCNSEKRLNKLEVRRIKKDSKWTKLFCAESDIENERDHSIGYCVANAMHNVAAEDDLIVAYTPKLLYKVYIKPVINALKKINKRHRFSNLSDKSKDKINEIVKKSVDDIQKAEEEISQRVKEFRPVTMLYSYFGKFLGKIADAIKKDEADAETA